MRRYTYSYRTALGAHGSETLCAGSDAIADRLFWGNHSRDACEVLAVSVSSCDCGGADPGGGRPAPGRGRDRGPFPWTDRPAARWLAFLALLALAAVSIAMTVADMAATRP